MSHSDRRMARTGRILRFLFKYRSAGVFSGLDLDSTTVDAIDAPTTEFGHRQVGDAGLGQGPRHGLTGKLRVAA